MLLAILGGGVALRLTELFQPPLDFHATRQLHSAEIARGMYYAGLADAPAWQRDMAMASQAEKGVIEPQFVEFLASSAYALLGGEALWVPRLLSISFWTLGALFLFLAVRRLVGRVGALVAASVFMFAPYAVLASRAFMPDPLMVALMAGALWLGVEWAAAEPPRRLRWACAAGLVTGLAVLVKLPAGFMLAPFCIALVIGRLGRAAFRAVDVYAYALLAAAPVAGSLAYGVVTGGTTLADHTARFHPELWSTQQFWTDWLSMVHGTVGVGTLGLALLGGVLVPVRGVAAALVAWVLGYVAMGLTLSHHTSTHDYYSLPLFPVLAVGIGVLAALAWQHLRERPGARLAAVVVGLVTLAASFHGSWVRLTEHDYTEDAARYAALGALFEPDDRIVGLVPDYGHAFRFFGWRDYRWWAATFDWALMEDEDFAGYWPRRTEGMDYFLVTDFGQYYAQPDLRQHLETKCRLVAQQESYWVFDLAGDDCAQP